MNLPYSVLVSGLILLISAPMSYALESGFYDRGIKTSKFKFLKKYDRYLYMEAIDEIDIGIRSEKGNSIYLKRTQLLEFLKNERLKNLLVIRFGKPLTYKVTTQDSNEIELLKPFLRDIGYKRVVILGSHSRGFSVLADQKLK